MFRWALIVIVLSACGARTDLVFDEGPATPSIDASVDAADAGGTGCRGLGRTPTVLLEDPELRPGAVALRAETLFFGAIDVRDLSMEQTGGIHSMSVRGGPTERLELDAPYYAGRLIVGVDYLVYHEVRATRTGGAAWAFSYPAIVVTGEGRETRRLVTELEEGAGRPSAMARLGDRLIFGRHRAAPASELGNVGRYEIRGDEEATILDRADVRAAAGEGRHAWLWLFDEGEGVLLRVTSASDVIEVERFGDFSCCWPWAADATTLYFRRGDTIEARRPGDGAEVIAEASTRSMITHAAVDDDFLYWADDAGIFYVSKSGGRVETLVDDDGSFVEGLTTDGCGVYYTVVNPPRVMAISAP